MALCEGYPNDCEGCKDVGSVGCITNADTEGNSVLKTALSIRYGNRMQQYGDHKDASRCLGMVWAGMLSQHLGFDIPPLPGSLCDLMMVAQKMMRANKPGHRRDDFVDIAGYADMAEQSRRSEEMEE